MAFADWIVAVVAGVIQGIFEWLPVSSEGNTALFLTFAGFDPSNALSLSLFLHAGTAISAAVYYRKDLVELAYRLGDWEGGEAFEGDNAEITYFVGATLVSGIVAVPAYLVFSDLASETSGGVFVGIIGVLLVLTGVIQKIGKVHGLGNRENPDVLDLFVVGILQGLAILPGISRSGTTSSALLLRGHEGESALRLSFILSIPASLGAGVLKFSETSFGVTEAVGALVASALVGYVTIDALMRVVKKIEFWGICVGLGGLAIVGGVLSVAVI